MKRHHLGTARGSEMAAWTCVNTPSITGCRCYAMRAPLLPRGDGEDERRLLHVGRRDQLLLLRRLAHVLLLHPQREVGLPVRVEGDVAVELAQTELPQLRRHRLRLRRAGHLDARAQSAQRAELGGDDVAGLRVRPEEGAVADDDLGESQVGEEAARLATRDRHPRHRVQHVVCERRGAAGGRGGRVRAAGVAQAHHTPTSSRSWCW